MSLLYTEKLGIYFDVLSSNEVNLSLNAGDTFSLQLPLELAQSLKKYFDMGFSNSTINCSFIFSKDGRGEFRTKLDHDLTITKIVIGVEHSEVKVFAYSTTIEEE